MSYFNFTPEQWRRMVERGTRFLEGVAAKRRSTDYTDLCRDLEAEDDIQIEPHDHALPHLLGEIARQSYKKCGLVLTALVLYKNGTEAGVDCGPGCPNLCSIGSDCSENSDCASGNCSAGHCTY